MSNHKLPTPAWLSKLLIELSEDETQPLNKIAKDYRANLDSLLVGRPFPLTEEQEKAAQAMVKASVRSNGKACTTIAQARLLVAASAPTDQAIPLVNPSADTASLQAHKTPKEGHRLLPSQDAVQAPDSDHVLASELSEPCQHSGGCAEATVKPLPSQDIAHSPNRLRPRIAAAARRFLVSVFGCRRS